MSCEAHCRPQMTCLMAILGPLCSRLIQCLLLVPFPVWTISAVWHMMLLGSCRVLILQETMVHLLSRSLPNTVLTVPWLVVEKMITT